VSKEGDDIEFLEYDFKPNRDWRRMGGAFIEECGIDYCGPILFGDMLKTRADGIHDIEGKYFEHWTQDYEGEWDSDFWIEGERIKYCGPLSPTPRSGREE
jgi:hypothetical protein